MIPMILIVGTVDVFFAFMRCPLHPEWSAPCSVNRFLGAIYWIFLLLTIILSIISANRLKKIKKQIENEFLEVTNTRIKHKKDWDLNWNDEDITNKVDNEEESKSEKFITKKW
jgi:hypothetical protein